MKICNDERLQWVDSSYRQFGLVNGWFRVESGR